MKIRNLLVFTITMVLATLCAPAQPRDGARTFTDHLGQRITISRYGTVLSFKDSKRPEHATDHAFRLCLSDGNSQCIDSNAPTNATSAELKVKIPEQGEKIGKKQALIVTATIRQGALTVTRQMTWPAGSCRVAIVETISASNSAVGPESRTIAVGAFEAGMGVVVIDKPCPPPPGGTVGICPADIRDAWTVTPRKPDAPGKIELTKSFLIPRGKSVRGRLDYDFCG